MKTALLRLGGDEVFGGYSTFRTILRPAAVARLGRWIPDPLWWFIARAAVRIAADDAVRKATAGRARPETDEKEKMRRHTPRFEYYDEYRSAWYDWAGRRTQAMVLSVGGPAVAFYKVLRNGRLAETGNEPVGRPREHRFEEDACNTPPRRI